MDNKILIAVALVAFGLVLTQVNLSQVTDRITGKATDNFQVNVTVGGGNAPVITRVVIDDTAVDLNEGPRNTSVNVNFTVTDANGANNLDDTTAAVYLNRSGETVRLNTTCAEITSLGNEANYTCVVQLWWYDLDGTWTMNASIEDLSNNPASNISASFTVNTLTSFRAGPGNLTFPTLSAGGTNTTSNNDPIVLNNTGNQNITNGNIQVNMTDLLGETTSSEAIYSQNFTVGLSTGGSAECNYGSGGIASLGNQSGNYTTVTGSNLSRGNYTISDGTAQESHYYCINLVGSELSSQSYSTNNNLPWVIQIT